MVRALLAGLCFSTCLSGAAEACTIIPSLHKPGSPEAIAEERAYKQGFAEAVANDQLVFVGRMTRERDVTLGEIIAGGAGAFGEDPPGLRSWFEPVKILKGSPDLPVTSVLSGLYGGTCGRSFSLKTGDLTIVWANQRNGYWVGDFTPMDILPYLEPLLR